MIQEVTPTSRAGFCPRGAAAELWRYQGPEIMLSGPAETGKTWACLQKLVALAWKYPGMQGVIIRKTYQSMHGSTLQTLRRILGKESPVKPYGGEKPEWFEWPNGSRVYVAGIDNPSKALSSERDIVYINQAEELEIDDYEVLRTRNTGRAGMMPYAQTFGDCNPGMPAHWIMQRAKQGILKLLYSRHEDNPTLYDDAGNITEQGKRTMAVLDALTGVRYKRLRLGLWVAAEGMVYEEWDRSVHVIDRFEIPKEWRRFRVIDFGFTNPFVCQWWAQDPDGRLYRYREIYMTGLLVQDAARMINKLSEGEDIEFTVADHDAEDRATLERQEVWTYPADKDISPGIQAVQARLRVAADHKPRIFFLRGSLVEVDSELESARKPTCTEDEFEGYVWAKTPGGMLRKELPVKENDHGLDCTRYLCYHLDAMPEPVKYERGFDD